ncbi:MAG: LCP family protein [Spirulinaceae cyanobacterium SM2_1_0]|nr:LCP family protein [Spirulinaceae cyanobacterium SM2_1_0]
MVTPLPDNPEFLHAASQLISGEATAASEQPYESLPLFQYKIERPVNILVMGVDRVPEAEVGSKDAFDGRTDTMLLLRFDPTDNTLRLLSLPRDTQVTVSGDPEVAKLNDANTVGGAALAVKTTSAMLNDVPIDRYVRITNDSFRELVDLVGGVEVFVPKDMQYTDVTQGLEIDLDKGWQTLDGDQAEQFARFRKDQYGDIGRVQRQQTLIKALRDRLQSPAILPRLPQAIRLMLRYVDTDLSFEEVLALVNFGMGLDAAEIQMVLLPGEFGDPQQFNGVSYWLMSAAGRDRVMNDYFDQAPPVGTNLQERAPKQARIAIQNATDDPNLGRQVVNYLAERGFNNVFFSEERAPRLLETTEVIVQKGDLVAAAALQEALDLGKVQADSTGDLYSEITLRVGSDWLERAAAAANEDD